MQPFHDDQTDLLRDVGLASYVPEVAQKIEEVYDSGRLGKAMARAREDYTAAVSSATDGWSPAEAVDALNTIYTAYVDKPVTPVQAATELGVLREQLAQAVADSHDVIVLALSVGKSVNRAAWESAFADASIHVENWRRASR